MNADFIGYSPNAYADLAPPKRLRTGLVDNRGDW